MIWMMQRSLVKINVYSWGDRSEELVAYKNILYNVERVDQTVQEIDPVVNVTLNPNVYNHQEAF